MAAKNSKAAKLYPSDRDYKRPADRLGGPFDDYEVKEALRTLTEAEKIKRNKALLRACKLEAKKQVQAATQAAESIQGGN